MNKSFALRLSSAIGGALLAMAAIAHAETPKLDPRNVPGPNAKPTPKATPNALGDKNLGMAIMGARVSGAGAVNFGAGATGANRINTGNYEVDFNRDVSHCFYAANSFESDKVATTVEPRSGNANGVFLLIQKIDGSRAVVDSDFYLTVYCAK